MRKKKQVEETFVVDTSDPIQARLPALVMEMRRAHEEIVEPKGWALPAILLMIPVCGAAVFLYLGFFAKEGANRNIRNFSRCAFFINLAWIVILSALFLLLLHYGKDIYHILIRGIGG